MHIYLLNGPPRSGKDTIGHMLAKMLDNAVVLKFATPLKMATHAAVCMLKGETKMPVADYYDSVKDDELPEFFGATPRKAYIQMSERFCKPLFGERFFGQLMIQQIHRARAESGAENVVITDSGFVMEAVGLIDEFGPDSITVIRVRRDGRSFEGDSRGYLDLGDAIPHYDIHNNHNKDYLRISVATLLAEMNGSLEEVASGV